MKLTATWSQLHLVVCFEMNTRCLFACLVDVEWMENITGHDAMLQLKQQRETLLSSRDSVIVLPLWMDGGGMDGEYLSDASGNRWVKRTQSWSAFATRCKACQWGKPVLAPTSDETKLILFTISQQSMNQSNNRAVTNKIIVSIIIFFELAIIFALVYFKFVRRRLE